MARLIRWWAWPSRWAALSASRRTLLFIYPSRPIAKSMARSRQPTSIFMRSRHHLSPGEDDNFGVVEPSALLGLWTNLTGTLATGSVGIVSIFLVIGGIVIMNVMLASVTERTREIGLRKSVGATRRDIMFQFVLESSVMSATGGVMGVMLA